MLQEIAEQPAALAKTIAEERAKIARLGESLRRREIDLIVLVARGSSDNAALFGRYLLEITTGIPVSLSAPSVYTLYQSKLNLKRALVIGVSQSGEGEDINRVLETARDCGAFTIGITNEPSSSMAGVVDETLLMHGGKERSVAATKTFTGQILLFYLLASALGPHITLASVSEIPDRVRDTLRLASELRELVPRYRYMRQCAVVARGLNYANAFELALKLMETCYVVAGRFSAADFLHGPIALVERDFPVILLMPPGKTFLDLKKLADRLRRLRAETVVISSAGARLPAATEVIRIPGTIPEIYTPIPYIVPGQLFTALLAEAKGLDPVR